MPIPPRRKTSFTGAIQDPIIRFAAELARAIQFHRLYPPEHPYVKDAAGVAYAACEVALNKHNPFTLGASEAGFFVEGEVIYDVPSVVEELARAFLKLNIHSLSISRGITEEQVKDFVIKFGELENSAIQGTLEPGEIDSFGKKLNHVEVNTYSYEKVLATEGDLLRKVKDVAAETGEDEIDLLEMLTHAGEGELGGVGGARLSEAAMASPSQVATLLVKGIEEAVSTMGQDISNLAQAGGILGSEVETENIQLHEKVLAFFDKIGSAMALHKKAGLSDVKESLAAIVSFLPQSSQEALFGKSFQDGEETNLKALFSSLPLKSRTNLLLNELLEKEGSPDEIRNQFETVVKRGAELAQVIDSITEKATSLGSNESVDRVISRISQALQSGIRPEIFLRENIYVVNPDLDTTLDYKAELAKQGFRVTTFTDSAVALEEIKRSPPDLLITEIKMHGTSGMELIRTLRHLPEPVPVVVATQYASFGNDFEIATYPKHAFFAEPFEIEEVVKKVVEFLPEKETPEGDEDEESLEALAGMEGKVLLDTEELETAQEVQASLLPESLPEIEGFDISVHYSPCKEVGGDYYDVMPAGDEAQTFVLADVSGKGVPAAMVMVLVRSLVHISMPQTAEPKDGIIELNRLLSQEMKQGIFVSGAFIKVDPKGRTITFCSAGQCPAVLWLPGRDKPEVSLLKHTGVVLGLGDTSYFREGTKEQQLQLEPGAGIMIYTDGIIEAMNRHRTEFGTTRLMRVVTNSAHMSAQEINHALRAAVNAFSGGSAQHDDITIMTIKCTK